MGVYGALLTAEVSLKRTSEELEFATSQASFSSPGGCSLEITSASPVNYLNVEISSQHLIGLISLNIQLKSSKVAFTNQSPVTFILPSPQTKNSRFIWGPRSLSRPLSAQLHKEKQRFWSPRIQDFWTSFWIWAAKQGSSGISFEATESFRNTTTSRFFSKFGKWFRSSSP